MYLAGPICDGRQLTRRDLDEWAAKATWPMISEYTVPPLAAEHPEGWNTGLEWIDSPEEKISLTGWATLSGIAALREDKDLDLKAIEKLLDRVAKTIHQAPNNTRSVMNAFVIAIGSENQARTSFETGQSRAAMSSNCAQFGSNSPSKRIGFKSPLDFSLMVDKRASSRTRPPDLVASLRHTCQAATSQ
jgi:hypothetical protein